MKFRIFILLLIATLTLLLSSCDKIEAPYVKSTNSGTTPGVEVKKTVLIEEFTGHQCPNCPRGAIAVNEIAKTYGSQVVVMSFHAGFFARTTATGNFTTDYRTAPGTELDIFFGPSAMGLPRGMVNRAGYNTTHLLQPDNLASAVANTLNQDAMIDLKISTTYNPISRNAAVEVKTATLKSLNYKLMLSVFVVEDSIVSPQKNGIPELGPDVILNFVHRHVLRASVNGTWGEELSAGNAVPASTMYNKNYNLTLSTAFNDNRVGIVAFVYDGNTYEVLQAAEKYFRK